jgi:hypothetical protein
MFLTSKLTLMLRPVRQLFLKQRALAKQYLAADSDCDVSRSVAAFGDEDVDDIATSSIAADWPSR